MRAPRVPDDAAAGLFPQIHAGRRRHGRNQHLRCAPVNSDHRARCNRARQRYPPPSRAKPTCTCGCASTVRCAMILTVPKEPQGRRLSRARRSWAA